MASSLNPHDPQSPIFFLDVTDAIKRSGSKPLFQCIGYNLHTVKIGRSQKLVKVYEGVPPDLITDESVKESIVEVSGTQVPSVVPV